MNRTVLFVDDETGVLHALKRLFMDDDLDVMLASSAAEAVDVIRNSAPAVIVSDNLMPGVSGIEFLEKAREISPDSIRIIMTGYADLQAAIDAINRCEVSRFISKPWNDRDLKTAVLDAVSRFNVIRAMQTADEATLLSLAQTIELKDPYTRGHCDRVAQYSLSTAERLGLTDSDLQHIKYGSWLHDCGKIGVPESILNYNGRLSDEQMNVIKKHSEWGAEVARLAKLPDDVVKIILYHHEKFDGTGYPRGLKGEEIPYIVRVVTIADFYDALSSDRPYRKAMPQEEAFNILMESRGSYVDPDVLDVFTSVVRRS